MIFGEASEVTQRCLEKSGAERIFSRRTDVRLCWTTVGRQNKLDGRQETMFYAGIS